MTFLINLMFSSFHRFDGVREGIFGTLIGLHIWEAYIEGAYIRGAY